MKIKREATVYSYIEEALVFLMRKKNYKDITITEICQKAGVTRMSFYRNFESKEDILRKWVTSVTDEFLELSGISYKNDSSKEYFLKLFQHMEQQKEMCKLLYRANLIYIIKDQFDRVFLEIHRDEYDEYKSYFLSGGVFNVFLLWLTSGCRESPREMAERLDSLDFK